MGIVSAPRLESVDGGAAGVAGPAITATNLGETPVSAEARFLSAINPALEILSYVRARDT